MGTLKMICFQVKGSIFGIEDSIFLAFFNLVKKSRVGFKEKSNTKANLKITNGMVKGYAGIQLIKFTQVYGIMGRGMDLESFYSFKARNL